MQIVRAERDQVRAELDQADKLADPLDLDREAERLADTAMDLGERLTDSDPAVVREVLRQFVARSNADGRSIQAGNEPTTNWSAATWNCGSSPHFPFMGWWVVSLDPETGEAGQMYSCRRCASCMEAISR